MQQKLKVTLRNFILSKLPNRSYFIVLTTLILWGLATIFIFHEVLDWPYIGAQFKADIAGKSIEVTRVDQDSPAHRAGILVGEKYSVIENNLGKRYKMTGLEAISGVYQLRSYAMTNATYAAKHEIWEFINKKFFILETVHGKRVTLKPEFGRHYSSLRAEIYYSAVQTLIVVMISVGILAFATRTPAVNQLVISGFALGVFNITSLLFGTRELIMSGKFVVPAFAIGGLATLTFFCALLIFLWRFPSPINRFPFGKLVTAWALFVSSAQYFQYFEFPIDPYQIPFLLIFLPASIICIIQWRNAHHYPLEHASIIWFSLIIIGVTGFGMLGHNIPVMLGYPPLFGPQAASFALTFVFIGIALIILRYQLFDINRIWRRVITWFIGWLLVLLTDLSMISYFNFEQTSVLPLSLLLAGWAYLPLRHAVLKYFTESKNIKIADHVPDLINSFSRLADGEEFDGRFVAFLRKVFNAKEIGPVGRDKIGLSSIEDNGFELRIPAVSGKGSILLIGKSGGWQLFSPNDTLVADSFVRLVRNMSDASKREFDKLQQERQRIVRDLHDDVAGRLLSMIYNTTDKQNASDAREALRTLKESLIVIEDTQSIEFSAAWRQIRQDAVERLEQTGFDVQSIGNIETERIFSAREYINFKRCVQEIVSNAIKYGAKGQVLLSADVTSEGVVKFSCRNQVGMNVDRSFSSNRGLANIQRRLEEVGGYMNTKIKTIGLNGQHFVIDLTLPLND